MVKEYYHQISEEYQEIAEKLCSMAKTHYPELAHINPDDIVFLEEYENLPKGWLARIHRVRPPYTKFVGKAFIIEVARRWVEGLKFDRARKVAMIYHELLHINPDIETGGLIDHDVKDFRRVIGRFGVDWIHTENLPNLLGDSDSIHAGEIIPEKGKVVNFPTAGGLN